jgi:RNA polymerase sigma-70 factor (ECF subfamily)
MDELIAKAQSGDQQALQRLLFDVYPELEQHLNNRLTGKVRELLSVDDVVQETFTRVFEQIESFQPKGQHSFVAWTKTIANNFITDMARRQNSLKRGGDRQKITHRIEAGDGELHYLVEELSAGYDTPSQIVSRDESIQALKVALSGLTDDQRRAITLHCLSKLTLDQTATEMGRTKDSVRGLIERGKRVLRQDLRASTLWLSRR